MRVIDAETRQVQQLESDGSESDGSAEAGKGKRKKASNKDVPMDDEYDSEEDEDFKES